MSQAQPVIAATEKSAFGPVPSTQAAAARLSDANPQPTAPATIVWPDPPPIPPSVKVDDAEAVTVPQDPVHSAPNTSGRVSDERTSTFDIPIGLFPAFAFGLAVLGFGFRFLTKHAAAHRAQEGHYQVVTTPADDYAAPANNGLAAKVGKDDFASFVSAVSDDGPLERIISSVHAREATLARLREDIGQFLIRVEPELSSPQKLAS